MWFQRILACTLIVTFCVFLKLSLPSSAVASVEKSREGLVRSRTSGTLAGMDVNEPPKHLIGKYLVTPSKTLDEILAKGIDRANVVTKDDLPPSHRIIPPGGMVTMDYRPTRLNVHISGGETPTITGVNYG